MEQGRTVEKRKGSHGSDNGMAALSFDSICQNVNVGKASRPRVEGGWECRSAGGTNCVGNDLCSMHKGLRFFFEYRRRNESKCDERTGGTEGREGSLAKRKMIIGHRVLKLVANCMRNESNW